MSEASAVHRRGWTTPALTLVAVVACVVLTVAILVSPARLFGLREPALHLVLDSVDACIAALVAFLLLGRFRRQRDLRSLLLVAGLGTLGLANAGGTLVAALRLEALEDWYPLSLRVAGSLLVAAGALARRAPAGRAAGWVCAALPVALLLGQWPLATLLPAPILASAGPSLPAVVGHPVVVAGHVVGAASFLVAAAVFATDAAQAEEPMLRWFAPACALGAFSRIHYAVFPSLYSGWIYSGDVLRTGCYLLLLVGAAREISSHWAAQPRLAVVADRRRLARELHDGVVQELGFISGEGALIEQPDLRERIVRAAHRGLDEARAAVEELAQGGDERFDFALHRVARQVSERYGARVVVDLDVSVDVTADQAHALLRIAREAAANAARHAGARSVGIGLAHDQEDRVLVVHDDGTGFDPSVVPPGGYGLTSMRDRAAGLPGVLDVRSAAGRGTTVTVRW